MMLRDLFDALEHEGADPDAEVGGDHVHQTETRDYFEAMDVQLWKRTVKHSLRNLSG